MHRRPLRAPRPRPAPVPPGRCPCRRPAPLRPRRARILAQHVGLRGGQQLADGTAEARAIRTDRPCPDRHRRCSCSGPASCVRGGPGSNHASGGRLRRHRPGQAHDCFPRAAKIRFVAVFALGQRLPGPAAREAARARAALAMAPVHRRAVDLGVDQPRPANTPAAWPPSRTSSTPTVRSRATCSSRAPATAGRAARTRPPRRRPHVNVTTVSPPRSPRRRRARPPSAPASGRAARAGARSARRPSPPQLTDASCPAGSGAPQRRTRRPGPGRALGPVDAVAVDAAARGRPLRSRTVRASGRAGGPAGAAGTAASPTAEARRRPREDRAGGRRASIAPPTRRTSAGAGTRSAR